MSNEFNVNNIMDSEEVPSDIVEYSEPTSLGDVLTGYNAVLDVDRSDLEIPRLLLLQAMSGAVAEGAGKPGQYRVTGFPAMDSVTVIPMRMAKRRELRDANFVSLCSSKNAEFGVGQPGGRCADCPMSQWENETHSAPPCTFFYSYVMFVVETGTLAMFDFKRTGISAGKKLNTLIATYGGLGRVGIQMKSASMKGKKGTYFTTTMDVVAVEPDVLALAQSSI